jgi:outer membrane lipoprotein-sorting protein
VKFFSQYGTWNCRVVFEKYAAGGTAIRLVDEETFEPVAMATVWVEGLLDGEVAIKDYSENEGMYDSLLKAGVIKKAHRQLASGYVVLPVCKLAKDSHN